MTRLPSYILVAAIAFVCGAITLDIALAAVTFYRQAQPVACPDCRRV